MKYLKIFNLAFIKRENDKALNKFKFGSITK